MNAFVEAVNANNILFKLDNLLIEVDKTEANTYGNAFSVTGDNGPVHFYGGKRTPKSTYAIGDLCDVYGVCSKKTYFNSALASDLTYDLLSTIDSILFSAEFMERFSLAGTSNYKCNIDGVSVDCYTAIPYIYGYDTLKNSLVSYLKTLGVQFRVSVRKNGNGTFMFNLKISSAKTIGKQVPAIRQLNSFGRLLLKCGNCSYVCMRAIASAITEHLNDEQVLPWDGNEVIRNVFSTNYRLMPIDGKIYYLQQVRTDYYKATMNSLSGLYDTYKGIMEIPLLEEIKISGTNHGFSLIPYLKGDVAMVDIPIRASLLPYSCEEIKDAIAEELLDSETINLNACITDVDWNLVRVQIG